MVYNALRPLLFALDPERAHDLTLAGLRLGHPLGLCRLAAGSVPALPRRIMGLDFANPVGLAAGLDKNGDCIDALGALGFGFVEVGTVTPRPQPGNPRPRLFRLRRSRALVNRFGFNNKGVDHVAERLRQRRYAGPVGVNIGKNRDTPVEQALDDYVRCLDAVHPYADYLTVNLSSPNTPGLRELQHGGLLNDLLAGFAVARQRRADVDGFRRPVAVKIAPDMSDDALRTTADAVVAHGMDALIATNTTTERPAGTAVDAGAAETGGLSGAPLAPRAEAALRTVAQHLQGALPLVGVGGIDTPAAARGRLAAGADLVQCYTGLVYEGPALPGTLVRALATDCPGPAES